MKNHPSWDIAARTHVGQVRKQNEDSFVVDTPKGRFAVIDGMGGRAAGAIAAELTRSALLDGADVFQAFLTANQTILANTDQNPERRGMGCVATAVDISGGAMKVAHVGDTRAYVASAAGTEQVTCDHTATAANQEAFGLSDLQMQSFDHSHGVTNDIGRKSREDVQWIEGHEVPFHRGDVLLLCSDGLHGLVPQSELFGLLRKAREQRQPAAELADHLIDLALQRGGVDNVTVIVVRRRHTADQLVRAISTAFSLTDPSSSNEG